MLLTAVTLTAAADAEDDATDGLLAADGAAGDEDDPDSDESVTFVVKLPDAETAPETEEETELGEDGEITELEDKADSDEAVGEAKRDVEESDVIGTAGANEVEAEFTTETDGDSLAATEAVVGRSEVDSVEALLTGGAVDDRTSNPFSNSTNKQIAVHFIVSADQLRYN